MRNFLFLACISLFISVNSQEEKVLNELIDEWHLAAANADIDAYFQVTTDDFVFLGTAPEERWEKVEFMSFCRPYFERGEAWDFKPSNRHWKFSEDGKTAWFDEHLDTWMQGCRGSGIVQRKNDGWMLSYYNLHVLIENDKIEEFIDLRKQE